MGGTFGKPEEEAQSSSDPGLSLRPETPVAKQHLRAWRGRSYQEKTRVSQAPQCRRKFEFKAEQPGLDSRHRDKIARSRAQGTAMPTIATLRQTTGTELRVRIFPHFDAKAHRLLHQLGNEHRLTKLIPETHHSRT